MNKAFVREPDETVSRCPACEDPGMVVRATTLDAWVPGDLRRRFADSACFCSGADCDVVYFDDLGGCVTRKELQRPIPGKDLDAPLCACFGLTREDIDDDIAEGRRSYAGRRAEGEHLRSTLQPAVTLRADLRSGRAGVLYEESESGIDRGKELVAWRQNR